MALNEITYEQNNYKQFGDLKPDDLLYCFYLDEDNNVYFNEIKIDKIISEQEYYLITYNGDEQLAKQMYIERSDYDKEKNANNIFFYFPEYAKLFVDSSRMVWRGVIGLSKNSSCIKLFDITNPKREDPIFIFTTNEEREKILKALSYKLINKYNDEIDALGIKINNLIKNLE